MPSNIEYIKGQTNLAAPATYSGGALPVSGDSLFFSDGSGVINVNMAALTAVDLARLETRPGFSADIGEAGNPMEITVDRTSTGVMVLSSRSARIYLKGGSGGIFNDVTVQMVNNSSQIYFSNCTIPTLRVYSGIVKCPSSVALDAVEVLGPGTVIAEEHGSDTLGNVKVTNGGVLIARRRIAGTHTVLRNGLLVYDVDTATTTGAGLLGGGRIEHLKGSMTLEGVEGEYDYSRLEKNTTINYTITLTEHEGLVERFGAVTPTFSRTTRGKGSRKIPA